MSSACGGDGDCLWFDYTPPSAVVKVRDASTGEPICDADASTDRGPAILRTDLCEYRIPVWFPTEDAGAEVMLTVEGYEPVQLSFPTTEDECGLLEQPPAQEVSVTPES